MFNDRLSEKHNLLSMVNTWRGRHESSSLPVEASSIKGCCHPSSLSKESTMAEPDGLDNLWVV